VHRCCVFTFALAGLFLLLDGIASSNANIFTYSYRFLCILSVICHICAPCLNWLTNCDVMPFSSYACGVQWHSVRWGPQKKGDLRVVGLVPPCYFEGPLFRKFFVQIHATVLTFGLRLRLWLGSALGLGLWLVEIVDFRNSRPSE